MRALTEPVLLDTNIAMYAAGRAHALQAPARHIIRAVAAGDLEAFTDAAVLQEILSRYLRTGERAAAFAVFDSFQALMAGRVLPVDAQDVIRARSLAEGHPTLSPRDHIHVAIMLRHGIRAIVTTDRHFDDVEGIVRIDPAAYEPDGGGTTAT